MTINKVLFKSKILADGSHPVMIRISHRSKIKYISTGQCCKEQNWSNTNKLVGARDPQKNQKNQHINSLYLELVNRLAEIEKKGIEPTIDLLLSDTNISENNDKTNLICLYDLKAKNCQGTRTKNEYRTFKKVVQKLYGDKVNIKKIDQVWVNELRLKIEHYYKEKNAQKNHFIKCFKGVYSFASEINALPNPKTIKIKDFPHEKKDDYLTEGEVSIILMAYKKEIVLLQSRQLSEKQDLALSIFILMIAFQGLSNIDMASVKVENVEIKRIKKFQVDWERYYNDIEYKTDIDLKQQERDVVVLNLFRHKTKQSVKIVCDYISILPIINKFLENKGPKDYLIPCFSKKTNGEEEKEIARCAAFYHSLRKELNLFLAKFCRKYNFEQICKITYKQARSAYANQVAQMDIPYNLIQKLLGQKQSVLERHYLIPPSEWEQSEVAYKIFNKSERIENLLNL